MDKLVELKQIMPPPTHLMHAIADWTKVEAELRSHLPSDYKAFVEVYGPGAVDEFLWVYHMAPTYPNLLLTREAPADLVGLRDLREAGVKYIWYPLFPEEGGLFPWGRTFDGDSLFWRTESDNPDQWSVVVKESRGPEWDEYPGTMTEFLAAVLTKRYDCPIFPEYFPSLRPTFEPFGSPPVR